jgi:phage shock protein PspC (stress-responsive transcriptional regulator)
MKKMFSVNLAGMLFHIDSDGYEIVNAYLQEIQNYFPNEEGKEIIQEIEARLAELFTEKINNKKQVISAEDVNEAIEIIGYPEDFSDSGENNKKEEQNMKGNKRLYRDPDNRILGGVCAGLGAYFNIEPVLIRLIFVLIGLFFASGILIYLILWLVTPEASTLAQKREMRGEKFDFSQFKKRARSEYEDIKNNFKK